MIKYLKQYTDKTYEELVNSLIWFDNPLKLKAIFAKLPTNEPKYKVYTALLTQTGTNAPVATVLENTLGYNISYSYSNVGRYQANFSNSIDTNKVLVQIGNNTIYDGLSFFISDVVSNEFSINTLENKVTGGIFQTPGINGVLKKTPIEIRVYN